MTGADAFLDAIFAAPQDDTPRLVYADWLDEQGHGDYAEYIRLCCRLATFEPSADVRYELRKQRHATLVRLFGEWEAREGRKLPSYPEHGFHPRGVLEGVVRTTAAEFVAAADRWFPLVHVRWLQVAEFDDMEQAAVWASHPVVRGVRHLTLGYDYPHRWNGPIRPATPARYTAALDSPFLDRLESLTIGPVPVSRRFIEELALKPVVRQLGKGGLRLWASNLQNTRGEVIGLDAGPRPIPPADALDRFLRAYGRHMPEQ